MKNQVLTSVLFFLSYLLSGQVNEGLVAKYYFNDGTLDDEMGYVNGIPNNTFFTTDRFGNMEAAIGFDMSLPSSVSLGDNFDEIYAVPDTSFSFSFWFKTTDTSNTNVLMISKYGNVNCWEDQREFFIRINDSKRVEMTYYSGLGYTMYRCVEGDSEIEDTLWHHAVVNYNGALDENDGQDRVGIYLDNIAQTTSLIVSEGALGDIQDGTAHLGLGSPLDSYGGICSPRFLDGALDDMRFYSRLLDAEEVDILFNEPNPFSGLPEDHGGHLSVEAYPNPCSGPATFSYFLDVRSPVSLVIYDCLGNERDVVKTCQDRGARQINWNSRDLPSGIYFYRLQAGKISTTGKLMVK